MSEEIKKMNEQEIDEQKNDAIDLRSNFSTPEALHHFENLIREKRRRISKKKTPKKNIKKLPGGDYDYVDFGTMLEALNNDYPTWSWKASGTQPVQMFMNWIVVSAELEFWDEGIKRTFFSPGAAQIQIKRGGDPSNWKDILSISNSVKSANTDGLKKAINVATGRFGDVYRNAPEDPISDEQKNILVDTIERASEIDDRYSLDNVERNFGDIDEFSVEDYEKVMAILKRVVKE